ncbi:hypothetical protein EDEG_02229 [Edhazardia aedis USNM 41457]|uniref:Uncharacterized protein n=1 Tax=Edhazardia aedis (strain USNM 41457) TaxID=1003232 RepID=J9D7G5_EDHAE|nr:hypothetical protein EDEG_02229 [Edhazardia aedis USNM 41457]|eukprot:EJW03464.1 hypothetical protein EDEG_02229 [Edhazardia aedis USNM 41457]
MQEYRGVKNSSVTKGIFDKDVQVHKPGRVLYSSYAFVGNAGDAEIYGTRLKMHKQNKQSESNNKKRYKLNHSVYLSRRSLVIFHWAGILHYALEVLDRVYSTNLLPRSSGPGSVTSPFCSVQNYMKSRT